MKTLVIGGTGTVGSQVVRGLLDRGAEVRILTRIAERARSLPQGIEAAVGDLRDSITLPPAFDAVEAVFLLVALSEDETEQGLAAVEAARNAGVRTIVYLSVHNLRAALQVPHFRTKVPIEEAIRNSGLAYTILSPNNFFQNDLWYRDAILLHGVYPQPVGNVGLSRVDIRDIADAAVIALTESGHDGRHYPLAGPDVLTGEQIAAIYSRHLGRSVRYAGDDLDAWAAQARTLLPEWMVRDLRVMYKHFQRDGLIASQQDLELQNVVLRRPARSFESFAAEVAAVWTTI